MFVLTTGHWSPVIRWIWYKSRTWHACSKHYKFALVHVMPWYKLPMNNTEKMVEGLRHRQSHWYKTGQTKCKTFVCLRWNSADACAKSGPDLHHRFRISSSRSFRPRNHVLCKVSDVTVQEEKYHDLRKTKTGRQRDLRQSLRLCRSGCSREARIFRLEAWHRVRGSWSSTEGFKVKEEHKA